MAGCFPSQAQFSDARRLPRRWEAAPRPPCSGGEEHMVSMIFWEKICYIINFEIASSGNSPSRNDSEQVDTHLVNDHERNSTW